MKVGYIRVSTKEQNTVRQEVLMKELDVEEIYIDKSSGKNTDRPNLKQMLNFLRKGDVLVVESISRLARNTKDLLEIVEILNNKGIEFVSKKEAIDTSTSTGKFMLTVFGAVAELERDYIKDRQREGIDIARKQGKHLGRPKAEYPKNWDSVIAELKKGNLTSTKAIQTLNMKRTTFYKLLKAYNVGG